MLPSGKILSEPIQFTSDKKFQNWLETLLKNLSYKTRLIFYSILFQKEF